MIVISVACSYIKVRGIWVQHQAQVDEVCLVTHAIPKMSIMLPAESILFLPAPRWNGKKNVLAAADQMYELPSRLMD